MMMMSLIPNKLATTNKNDNNKENDIWEKSSSGQMCQTLVKFHGTAHTTLIHTNDTYVLLAFSEGHCIVNYYIWISFERQRCTHVHVKRNYYIYTLWHLVDSSPGIWFLAGHTGVRSVKRLPLHSRRKLEDDTGRKVQLTKRHRENQFGNTCEQIWSELEKRS